MSLTKTIEIDGQQVPFRASAAIPRIYRVKFHRDIGMVNDMYAESRNDEYKGYKEVATQEDFDKF